MTEGVLEKLKDSSQWGTGVGDSLSLASPLDDKVFDNSMYLNKGIMQSDISDIIYYLGYTVCDEYGDESYNSLNTRRKNSFGDDSGCYGWRPPYWDGTLGIVHMQATQNLAQSLLPAGAESISAVLFQGMESRKKLLLKPESTTLTDQLRWLLEKPAIGFKTTLNSLLEDFTMYGNCILEIDPYNGLGSSSKEDRLQQPNLEKSRLKLIPLDFEGTTFELEDGGRTLKWVYNKTVINNGWNTEVTHKIFTQTSGSWNKRVITEVNGIKRDSYDVYYDEGTPAVIVCVEGKYFSTSYGKGSGLIALPFVKSLNWAADKGMYSVEKTVEPPILYATGIRFMADAYGMDALDLRPGAQTEFDMDPELVDQTRIQAQGSPIFNAIKAEPLDMQYLQILTTQNREQIQAVFYIDPILGAGTRGQQSARTATEILQREAQSLILYRGKAETFKTQMLTPLLNTLIRVELEAEYKKIKAQKKNISIEIKYLSLDTQRGKDINLERLERTLATIASIAPDSLDQEMVDEYKKEAAEEII